MCGAADNHNYMCHTCAIFRFELQLRVVLQSGYIICLIFGEKWNVL